MPIKIFAVDDNELNLKMVSATLKSDGYEVFTAPDAAQALASIDQANPNLIILDVLMPDMDGYELCRRLRDRPNTANVPIIILTALSELDERLKAFDAGADDFIAKPFQPQELLARIKVLLRRVGQEKKEIAHAIANGEVTAVFSLRGGAGCSSLAANLTVGLAQIWPYRPALVDMALVNGQAALMLDLPLRNSWGDLASVSADEVELELINRVLLSHDSGAYVLAAPRRPEDAELLSAAQVTRVLELMRQHYEYVILDMPHDFTATTLAALDQADRILLLLAPELASIRCASVALEVFEKLEYPKEKIELVLNWNFKGKGLQRVEIEKALKRPISVVIPYAADDLVSALTLGKPPVFQEPASPLGSLFEDLAYLWSKEEHKSSPPQPEKDGYTRVHERDKARKK